MDNNVLQELTEKLSESRACIAFIFTKEGYTQTLIHGTNHNLMSTLANEMHKHKQINDIVEGASFLIQERKKES